MNKKCQSLKTSFSGVFLLILTRTTQNMFVFQKEPTRSEGEKRTHFFTGSANMNLKITPTSHVRYFLTVGLVFCGMRKSTNDKANPDDLNHQYIFLRPLFSQTV